MNVVKGVVEIQRKLYEQTGRKTDAHYSEGQGALFVYMGEELRQENVVFVADEMTLLMHGI